MIKCKFCQKEIQSFPPVVRKPGSEFGEGDQLTVFKVCEDCAAKCQCDKIAPGTMQAGGAPVAGIEHVVGCPLRPIEKPEIK